MGIGWIIFWSVLALLGLLLVAPVRVSVGAQNDSLSIIVRYLFFRFRPDPEKLLDKGARKQAEESVAGQKDDTEAEQKEARSARELIALARRLLRAAGRAGGVVRRHLVLDGVLVCVKVCGDDAKRTAETFTNISSLVWTLLGQIGAFCVLKAPSVFILPDFTDRKTLYDISFRAGIRPLFVLAAAVKFVAAYLKDMPRKGKKNHKTKGGKKYESTAAHS